MNTTQCMNTTQQTKSRILYLFNEEKRLTDNLAISYQVSDSQNLASVQREKSKISTLLIDEIGVKRMIEFVKSIGFFHN
jgi:hypothetical protein